MTRPKTLLRIAIGIAIAITGLGLPAHADHAYNDRIDPQDGYFRDSHPIRVYVDIDADNRRRIDHDFEHAADHSLRQSLPSYVQVVDNPRFADMVLKVDQDSYDLKFRVVDRDRENKEYKGSQARTKGRCGQFYQAYYTEVKEVGVAHARYSLQVRMRRGPSDHDRFRLETQGAYDYITGLKARTNCGVIETRHAPNTKIKDALARSAPDYRATIAQSIQQEAAYDLGRALARQVVGRSDRYYTVLAAYIGDRRGRGYRDESWRDDDRDWYDRNDHHRPHR